MKAAVVFGLVVLPQFLLVAGLAVREEWALATGAVVVLEVRPYDPMDPLAGRYLRTPLAIERLDLAAIVHDEGVFAGGDVWVVLAPGAPCWKPVAVRAARPESDEGRVCLCGEVIAGQTHGQVLAVRYAIGRFYIPAGGKDPSARADLALRLRVTASGSAAVEDLLVGGKPYADWNR